ncbi:MAG: ATP-grasp domain-containing protein [Gemmatimonadota bacterium]|nr:ATP-grasp domain-containing protein [Gemmatimonadota bacterium]
MARVLVTDGGERSALAVARSLRRAGHDVIVGSVSGRSLAGASRGCEEIALADPVSGPEEFANDLLAAVASSRADVVLPISEAALLAALPLNGHLGDVALPFVSAERFRRICDKTEVFERARDLDIAVPAERVLSSPDEGREGSPAGLRYPLVVKPSRSVGLDGGRRTRLTVRHAADERALSGILESLPPAAYPIHLQERIEGPGVGVFLLPWRGRLLARFAHRRLREKPPSGGVSVYRESVAIDPDLEARSLALLEAFGWEGVAMVEYKLSADGRPYLMEINGRFWGSLQLAIDAGVDFPRLLVDAALGERVEPVREYRLGVRTRWLWGDVDHLLLRLRRRPEDLDLPRGAGGRLSAVGGFLAAFGGGRLEVERLSDPGPALREASQWVSSVVVRRRGARAGDATA